MAQRKDLLTDVPGKEMQGINMLEYAGQDSAQINQQVAQLTARLDEMKANQQAGRNGYQVCSDLESINRIYNMRKKAVGLLGAAKGRAKPVAFTEDTCVPPENLADFIVEFRALLDSKIWLMACSGMWMRAYCMCVLRLTFSIPSKNC